MALGPSLCLGEDMIYVCAALDAPVALAGLTQSLISVDNRLAR